MLNSLLDTFSSPAHPGLLIYFQIPKQWLFQQLFPSYLSHITQNIQQRHPNKVFLSKDSAVTLLEFFFTANKVFHLHRIETQKFQ